MTPGSTIAHYRITAKLGEGGVPSGSGAVYRATDTKLNRDVAIKVLPEALANDPDYLARFTREAQVLAALNHPHIAAIYGVEDRAIVMELVEGRDLPTPLPLAEALPIARQIAEALEAAHDRGIIHRDLKPANVKVTPEGVVKVLDFGLAKAPEPAASTAGATLSPTLTLRATQAGLIMGTAAYMAPEQAAGKTVDRRADIWAFGVVLYELLTGARLFEGETVAHTLAAVLRDEIDLAKLPAATPSAVRDLLARCLDRDPRTRLRDIGEARVILSRPPPPAPPPVAPAILPVRSSKIPWAIAALMTLAAVGAGILARRESGSARPLMRLNVDLGTTASTSSARPAPAISPDGGRIVFTVRAADGREQLAVRPFDQPKSTAIPGTEGGVQPFFSPEGQWLGFFADRKLKKVSLAGGAPVALCDISNPRGASWGEDGNIVFTPDIGAGLWRIAASGGAPQAITKPADQGQFSHTWPQILRGGKSVLFTARRSAVSGSDDAEIAFLSLDTGKWKTLRGGYFGRYLPSGHLLYVLNGSLFGVGFNPDRGETEGTPVQLLDDVAGNTITAAGYFDYSRTGTFLYASGKPRSNQSQVVWLDSSGTTQPLLTAPRQYVMPKLSPDGEWLALGVGNLLASEVHIFDLRRGTLTQLTFSAQRARYPVWAPDGIHLVYATVANGDAGSAIWWIRRDGGGQPYKLLESSQPMSPYSISPDGRHLAYAQDRDLWILPLEKTSGENPRPGKPERFLESPRNGGIL